MAGVGDKIGGYVRGNWVPRNLCLPFSPSFHLGGAIVVSFLSIGTIPGSFLVGIYLQEVFDPEAGFLLVPSFISRSHIGIMPTWYIGASLYLVKK